MTTEKNMQQVLHANHVMNGTPLTSKLLYWNTTMVKKHQKNGGRLKKHVTAIIQARMSSKRLPAKAMMKLAGKPMIQHVLENARAIEAADKVVLATGLGEANKPLLELASSIGIETILP